MKVLLLFGAAHRRADGRRKVLVAARRQGRGAASMHAPRLRRAQQQWTALMATAIASATRAEAAAHPQPRAVEQTIAAVGRPPAPAEQRTVQARDAEEKATAAAQACRPCAVERVRDGVGA